MTRGLTRLTATLVAAVAVLTGCTPTSPVPTSVPSVAPELSPTTAPDPLATVTSLVARPEALELRDADGTVVQRFDYRSDAATAIATLTTVFAAQPVSEEHSGSGHFPPSTAHRWGVFELWEKRYVDNWADFDDDERTLYLPSFGVVFTGGDANGVALTTEQGISAATGWAELLAEPELQTNPTGCSGPYLDFVEFPETWSDSTEHILKVGVDFVANSDESLISQVRAPMVIHEDGCA